MSNEKTTDTRAKIGKRLDAPCINFVRIKLASQASITASYNKIIERTGLKRIRIHDARHTHATLFLEQGESLKVVQERLGHEKADVLLNRYAHVLPRMQRKAVDTFGKRLFGHTDVEVSTSEQPSV